MKRPCLGWMASACFALGAGFGCDAETVTIGTKMFTEGFVLGEYAAEVLEQDAKVEVARRFGLGATGIVYQALQAGEIDLYPEYTGTIAETLLDEAAARDPKAFRRGLEKLGLVASRSLGFSNNYAVAVTADFARRNHLEKISQLAQLREPPRVVFSSEFMSRADGFAGLKSRYGLDLPARSLEHSLAFEAIRKGEADVVDVYTTDAKIEKLGLVVLEDDRQLFPRYEAVLLARRAFVERHARTWATLNARMEGRLSEALVRRMNFAVETEKQTVQTVVANARGNLPAGAPSTPWNSRIKILAQRTREHLVLVMTSLGFSVLIGLPLGILADRRKRLGQFILLISGMIQTIPSLALLCFLIPVFGIGLKPALAALCLYGLLPVVLNTVIGLNGISQSLRDTAKALGLGFWHRLWHVELPLAAPNILAGIKTSAIVGIGTATLAALIGAGGYGASIVAGLAINDNSEILAGAIPAALLSFVAYGLFWVLERGLISKGL